jgi:energy-coupling factor transporter transmembrane protein EcfT
MGSVYFATFILAMIGVIIVVANRRGDRWWRFLLFGLAASVVPAALTIDPFHTLRMIAFPVFLLLLMLPAVEWMIEGFARDDRGNHAASVQNLQQMLAAMTSLLLFAEAAYFHIKYYEEGPKRGYVFDAAYKPVYDQAVAQPDRPIYLEDGYWGPMYVHALWYATLEARDTAEFVHLPYGEPPPPGAVVISSEQDCSMCTVVSRDEIFMLYIAR